MKRKNLILTALTFVVVALGGLNLSISNKQKAAETLLANIEATAAGEGVSYPKREGKPEVCTLYKAWNGQGEVKFSLDNFDVDFEAGWQKVVVEGLRDVCDDKGSGCVAYSCQQILLD